MYCMPLKVAATWTGAIMTAWPSGDGIMNAGMDPSISPPTGGVLLGRPRPRFTGTKQLALQSQATRHVEHLTNTYCILNPKIVKLSFTLLMEYHGGTITLPGSPRFARKFCTLLVIKLNLGCLPTAPPDH